MSFGHGADTKEALYKRHAVRPGSGLQEVCLMCGLTFLRLVSPVADVNKPKCNGCTSERERE